jgi:hypothetical protein
MIGETWAAGICVAQTLCFAVPAQCGKGKFSGGSVGFTEAAIEYLAGAEPFERLSAPIVAIGGFQGSFAVRMSSGLRG